MSTLITQSLHKNKINRYFIVFCFALLSVYPVYRNFYYSNGIKTYERHIAVMQGRSEFYNPWQYRVLCPYAVEAMLWIYDHSIDKIYPIEQKFHFNIENTSGINEETSEFIRLMQTPGAMKYMIIFIFFRFVEHFIIFCLAWKLWAAFIKNKWLIFFGINFLALAFGNAVTAADLSFNTYMDIILYLLAANIIIYKKNPFWIIPITLTAAFNRETGMLIPFLYILSQFDLTQFSFRKMNVNVVKWPDVKPWVITAFSYIFFFSVFFALRHHFGYRPQQVWKAAAGWPMLKLNLFSAVGMKAYMELIGTFGVIPLIILYCFKTFPYILKKWFLCIVPAWFAIHFISVVAYQTRLFMVPMILIMMPMILLVVEKIYNSPKSSEIV